MKQFKDPKFFIELSKDIKDIYGDINYHDSKKILKILIVFDDMIANMISTKQL